LPKREAIFPDGLWICRDSHFLDFNGHYAIMPYLRVFAEANNLTNQSLRYYQGIPDRLMQDEYYNWRFTIGLKLDL
jgi:hypothetical protein